MQTRNQVTVRLEQINEHEQKLIGLICDISLKSTNCSNEYHLITSKNNNDKADIVITTTPRTNIEQDVINSPSCDFQLSSESNINQTIKGISRPLLASQVLDVFEKFTQQSASNEKMTDDEEICFDLAEDDLSNLAIVDDQTQANPANDSTETIVQSVSSSVIPFIHKNEQVSSQTQSPIDTQLHQQNDNLPKEPFEDITIEDASVNQPRALVVDDSASVRKQLELELNLFTVNVDYAETAEQAFDLINKHHYDIAFLDVVLPDKDGFHICKHIKKTSKETIAIMLTGKAKQNDKIKGSLAGCDAYLVKPVGRETFQNSVNTFLTLKKNESLTDDTLH